MRRAVIRGTLSSMRFGADAWGRLAVVPAFVLVLPWQCSLAPRSDTGLFGASASPTPEEPVPLPPDAPPRDLPHDLPPAVSAAIPKQEQPGPRIPAAPPPAPPLRAVTLPDEVRLHLEIDEQGRVAAATSDSDSPALERCLQVVARRLPFPAPGRPAVVD